MSAELCRLVLIGDINLFLTFIMKRSISEDFWDLIKELDNYFFDYYGVHLYNVTRAKNIIDNEYARKRKHNTEELDENGKLPTISERTLRYYWKEEGITNKEIKGNPPNESTLDIICIALGYECWSDFCRILKREVITEDTLFNPKDFVVEKMKKGETYRIGWFPRYFIDLKYLGDYKFKVISHSYNLRKRHRKGNILTIYGCGIRYTLTFDKVTDSKDTHVEGYPLYPTIFIKTQPEQFSDIEDSVSFWTCS